MDSPEGADGLNRRILAIGLALRVLAGCRPMEGAPNIGDPHAPELGNGGFDA